VYVANLKWPKYFKNRPKVAKFEKIIAYVSKEVEDVPKT